MVLPVLFLIPIIYFSLLQIYLNTAEQWLLIFSLSLILLVILSFSFCNFQHVFLLCHEDIEKLSNYTERLHKALEHYLSGYTGYCVAVSLPHHGLMGILEGLNEASDTMNLRYIVSDNRIYYAGQEYNANYALFDDQIKEITSAVLYKDIHGSSTRLDTFLAKGQMNMYSTKDFANHLIYKLSNQIHTDEFKVQAASYAVKIYMSHEIPEVKSLLCSFLENCIKHLNKESQSNTACTICSITLKYPASVKGSQGITTTTSSSAHDFSYFRYEAAKAMAGNVSRLSGSTTTSMYSPS